MATVAQRSAADRDEVFARADVVFQVRTLGANPEAGRADLARIRSGQVLIGVSDPLTAGPELSALPMPEQPCLPWN